jgi:hypothetical protein
MVATVRISVVVDEPTWRRLRDLAADSRVANGRASVSAVAARMIEERLAAGKAAGHE